jgi:predicted LPLAT superfamily acyltransferase
VSLAQAPAWAARRERGNLLALRFMAWVAVALGRPMARLLLHPITGYFLLFGTEARRHSARSWLRNMSRNHSTARCASSPAG